MVVPLKSAADATVTPLSAVDKEIPISYNKDGNSSDGGGGNMNNDYVTHPELKLSEEQTQHKLDNLDNKITQVDNKIDYKFDELDKKIDSKFDLLNSKLDAQNKLIWWIIRLLTAGVVLPAIAYFVKTIFLK